MVFEDLFVLGYHTIFYIGIKTKQSKLKDSIANRMILMGCFCNLWPCSVNQRAIDYGQTWRTKGQRTPPNHSQQKLTFTIAVLTSLA